MSEKLDLSNLKDVFPWAPKEVWDKPPGSIDLLIGGEYKQIQTAGGLERDGCAVANLRVSESKFGCGWVLSGTHPLILIKEKRLTNTAQLMMNSVKIQNDLEEISSNKMLVKSVAVHLTEKRFATTEFFEAEDLGVCPIRSCVRCKSCDECGFRAAELTQIEKEVVEKQQSLLVFNKEDQRVEASYVWTEDVLKLRDNKSQAVGFEKSVEKKLIREEKLEAYNEELRKAIEKGFLVELGEDDLVHYEGPVSYVSHFPVYNPSSKSTPVRVVTNTSLVNRTCNLSPNDCMATPPNALSNLLQVFLRWRTYPRAMNMDVSKAYQIIHTGQLEKNVCRLVWRWGDQDGEWKIYAWAVMTFGDQLASLILELVKKMGAEMGADIDPEAAEIVMESTYVDDTLGGGTTEMVDRFMGERLPDGSYTGTLPQILAKVGLHPKVLLVDGETDKEIIDMFSDKVLGHIWKCTEDVVMFKLHVNLPNKSKSGEKIDPDLTHQDIPRLPHLEITKKKLLSWINSLYDPTGVLSPLTIKLKIAYRRLIAKEYGELEWDQQLPQNAHLMWEKLITEFIKYPNITIP